MRRKGASMNDAMIEVPTGAGPMPAYLVRPAGGEPAPAVLVIQEAFGLNAHIKDVARRIAGEGYVALAPDMFWRGGRGRTAGYDQLPQALQLMGELRDDDVIADVGSAIAYLVACALPEKIAAAVPFYGGGIPVERTATLRAPVLAFFGDQDPFIPLDQVERLKQEAARLGKPVEVVVYPGAPHGFFCNERDSYRREAAADAWERLKRFFAQHLRA